MDYKQTYNRDYFTGKNSFFWRFGYGRFSKFYFTNMFKPLIPYVKKTAAGRVLDVGCAYGFMLDLFPSSFQKFGVDVSEFAVRVAKKRSPAAEFRVWNIEKKLPFKSGFFDVVLLNDVLEHVENPELALRNVGRVLKKGGLFYITTPNLNPVRKLFFKRADEKEHHISLLSKRELIKLLKKVGFKIIEHWTFFNLGGFVDLKFKSAAGTESRVICRKRIL